MGYIRVNGKHKDLYVTFDGHTVGFTRYRDKATLFPTREDADMVVRTFPTLLRGRRPTWFKVS